VERTVPQNEYGEITLLVVGRTFWARRWLFLGMAMLCLGMAVAVSFLITPLYRATTILAPSEITDSGGKLGALSSQLGGLAALAGLTGNGSAKLEESIAILGSRSFTEKFIADRDLLPVLFARVWDPETESWLVDEPKDIPTLGDGYLLMTNAIRQVKRDMASGLLSLSIDWKDPALAADWANGMISDLNLHLRQRAVKEAQKSIEYLNSEMAGVKESEARSVMYSLLESQVQKIMLANVQEDYAFRVLDPAVPPEQDEFVKPNRPLLAALGLAAGLALAAFLSLFLAFRERLA
jgi:uncharacterized protein involved in exopolysaccharide biosynthesis